MRLTEVMTLFNNRLYQMPNNKNDYSSAVVKLGQLEDIEEELGIDLITLFKAIDHIYYKENDEIRLSITPTIYVLEKIIEPKAELRFKLTDYGKTWALTKEELEQRKKGAKNGKA